MTKPDIAKRKAVMSSEAFRIWWAARQDESPRPADPYRAYMIDRGLHARHAPKESWENVPNRRDLAGVDNLHAFAGGFEKPTRRPPRGNRGINRPARRKARGTSIPERPNFTGHMVGAKQTAPIAQRVDYHVAAMSEHFHVPAPNVVKHRGTHATPNSFGFYRAATPEKYVSAMGTRARLRGEVHVPLGTEKRTVDYVKTKDGPYGLGSYRKVVKKEKKPEGYGTGGWQALAVTFHETGHSVHQEALNLNVKGISKGRDAVVKAKVRPQEAGDSMVYGSNATVKLKMESGASQLGREYAKAAVEKGTLSAVDARRISWYGRHVTQKYFNILQPSKAEKARLKR